jgi:hypothetical protein
MPSRNGSTLIEQLLLLVVLSVCLAIVTRAGVRVLDAATVHGAARDVSELFAMARDRAMATGTRTAVQFDHRAHRVLVNAGTDTFARLDLASGRAVLLNATRDSMAYLSSRIGLRRDQPARDSLARRQRRYHHRLTTRTRPSMTPSMCSAARRVLASQPAAVVPKS